MDSGTLPAGFRFGPYVVSRCIGHGAMGRVYAAEHSGLHKTVALKVMARHLYQVPGARDRFLLEGRAAAAVTHPNVVDIKDVGVLDDVPYLVMEMLEGQDLETYLHDHCPMHQREIARVLLPIMAGLAEVHKAGIVHRDLKPENIFLSRGPHGEIVPKLLDFGVSKLSQKAGFKLTAAQQLVGTPHYLPPEGVRGAASLTPQADQYSLGVIMYECATGQCPYDSEILANLLDAIATARYEAPRTKHPGVSIELEAIILRAMSLNPEDRYVTVTDMGRALLEHAGSRTRAMWGPSFGMAPVSIPPNSSFLSTTSLLAESNTPLTTTVDPAQVGLPMQLRPRRRAARALGVLGAVVTSVLFAIYLSFGGKSFDSVQQGSAASAGEGTADQATTAATLATELTSPSSETLPTAQAPSALPKAVEATAANSGSTDATPETSEAKAPSRRSWARPVQAVSRAVNDKQTVKEELPEPPPKPAPTARPNSDEVFLTTDKKKEPTDKSKDGLVGSNQAPILD